MNHHTKLKGDLAVAKVIADLTEKGFDILIPISEHLPFDLVVYKEEKLYRIQVKYSSIINGCLSINLYSSWADKNGSHRVKVNKNLIDLYAIYNSDTGLCYYLDTKDFKNSTQIRLRIIPTKNGQNERILFAKDYLEIKL